MSVVRVLDYHNINAGDCLVQYDVPKRAVKKILMDMVISTEYRLMIFRYKHSINFV